MRSEVKGKKQALKVSENPLRVCWCVRSGERNGVGTFRRLDAPEDGCVEFFVDSAGSMLMRRTVSDPAESAGTTEYSQPEYAAATVVLTGAHKISEFCKMFVKCGVPKVVEDRLRMLSGSTDDGDGPDRKERRMRTTSGKSVLQTWEDLFVENEKRKDKWTDEQLGAEFKARAPESKGNPRPSMMRSFYNNGTYSFEKLGKAEDRKLPRSNRYDGDGNVIEPGHRVAGHAADADRASRAKAGKQTIADIEREKRAAKKKVAKKANKKAGKAVAKKAVAKK